MERTARQKARASPSSSATVGRRGDALAIIGSEVGCECFSFASLAGLRRGKRRAGRWRVEQQSGSAPPIADVRTAAPFSTTSSHFLLLLADHLVNMLVQLTGLDWVWAL